MGEVEMCFLHIFILYEKCYLPFKSRKFLFLQKKKRMKERKKERRKKERKNERNK